MTTIAEMSQYNREAAARIREFMRAEATASVAATVEPVELLPANNERKKLILFNDCNVHMDVSIGQGEFRRIATLLPRERWEPRPAPTDAVLVRWCIQPIRGVAYGLEE